jgi:cytochrome c oxidase subunit 4
MADKGSKAKSGGAKSAAKAAPKADEHDAHEGEAKAEAAGHDAHDDHGHGVAAHGAKAHEHAPNYREYFTVFGVLLVLTILEVAITKVPGINRHLMGVALVGMALTKAAFVGLFYMHLKHETKFLKLTVVIPMAAPTIYALVLISEAAWRLTR